MVRDVERALRRRCGIMQAAVPAPVEESMSLPLPVYEISAESAFERGLQYGGRARPQIAASIETYRSVFRSFVNLGWEEARSHAEGFREPIAAYDRGLLEEM